MGSTFALNLSADGRQVLAYYRDPARLATLQGAGVKAVSVVAGRDPCHRSLLIVLRGLAARGNSPGCSQGLGSNY